jgi:hypothetical protein
MEAKDFIATYLTGHVMEVMSPSDRASLELLGHCLCTTLKIHHLNG